VDDPLDARAAAHAVRELTGHRESVVVERFVPGGEVAVEGLLDDGRFSCLALFDKPDPPQGPYFPETVLITPSRLAAPVRAAVIDAAAGACAAVGLRRGPVHVEFRIDEAGRPWFLELAARTIGGRCASVLTFAGGTTLEELVLRQALGLVWDGTTTGSAGVLMVPVPHSGIVTAVNGVAATAALDAVTEVVIDVSVGSHVHALPHGDRYPAFVMARGDGPAEVEAALAKAAATLQLVIAPDR
jgi:biotin carboxylase